MTVIVQAEVDSPGPWQSKGLIVRNAEWFDLAELLKPSSDQLLDFMTSGSVIEHFPKLHEKKLRSLTDQLLVTVLAYSVMATGGLRVLIQMITLNTHQNHWNPPLQSLLENIIFKNPASIFCNKKRAEAR